jgi:hypothetical protein
MLTPTDVLTDCLRADAAGAVPPVILQAKRLGSAGIAAVRRAPSTHYCTAELYCAIPPKPLVKLLTAAEAEELASCRSATT